MTVVAGARADDLTRIGGFSSFQKTQAEYHAELWAVTNTVLPWRRVVGVTNYIPAAANWYRVRGKVEQVGPAWVLVSGQAGNESALLANGLFFVRNLPYSPTVGDSLSEGLIGKRLGQTSYKAASGELRRALVIDHGVACEAQTPAALAVEAPKKK